MAIHGIGSGNVDGELSDVGSAQDFSKLFASSATKSAEVAQATGEPDRETIRVVAPYDRPNGRGGVDGVVDSTIEIEVRPLRGNELGDLEGKTDAQIETLKDAAALNKSNEDRGAYGRTTSQLKDEAIESEYFDSPAHNAWAQAAEARTGGRIEADWWKEFDPFGGTAGNGPDIEISGEYPGVASKIAMGHDTDWSLGRHFGAGPLAALQGADEDPSVLGRFGLNPFHRLGSVDLYTNGHPDWGVEYKK